MIYFSWLLIDDSSPYIKYRAKYRAAALSHEAFEDVSSMFAVIDLNMLQYRLSIIKTCILLDLFNLECNSAGSSQPEGNDGANLQPE